MTCVPLADELIDFAILLCLPRALRMTRLFGFPATTLLNPSFPLPDTIKPAEVLTKRPGHYPKRGHVITSS